MKLSPQKQYLINLLKDGNWLCSNHIDPHVVRDYRKRLSELNREGYTIKSDPCNRACGINHKAGVHMYRLVDSPKKVIERADFDSLPPIKVNGRWQAQVVIRREVVPA